MKKAKPHQQDRLQLELARLRARHHVHDAARIITDAKPFMPADKREIYTQIVGGLSTLERSLDDLAPGALPNAAAIPSRRSRR
jgi:hypothetical protein